MMTIRWRAVVLPLLFSYCSFHAQASHPKQWIASTFQDFQQGSFHGVSLTSDGKLVPAPALEELFDTGEAFLYSAVADPAGTVYIGSGSEGKIFRMPLTGSAEQWATLPESGVYALAVDSAGRIYAGTSPDGKVYRLTPEGEPQVFFEPLEKYIWALAIDSRNHLYVATGPKGNIYRVTPQGSGSLFYDSSETHVVSLGWDLEGNLLAGTAPEALLLRISPQGKAFVLYDSPLREVKSITTDRYGNIYASALAGGPVEKVSPKSKSNLAPQQDASEESKVEIPATTSPEGRQLEVFRVDRENRIDTLYSSKREMVYAQLLRNDGTLLLATGSEGRILSVSPERFVTILVQTPEEQVTQLVESKGSVYALTSNLGKVFRISSQRSEQAGYESDVLDAGMLSDWGNLHWTVSGGTGAGIRFFSRSGNSKKPNPTWSEWSDPYTDRTGSAITSPAARYLQWKLEFSPESRPAVLVTTENAVELVTVTYLQRNRAPELASLTVHAPGVAFARFPPANPAGGVTPGGPDGAHLRSLPREIRELDGPRTFPPPRKIFVPGARSFSWEASDPNDDDLTYALYYRRQEESSWTKVADSLQEKQYTLDGVSFPDGIYFVKIVATDLPGNPRHLALEDELVSKAFVISNSAPQIEWNDIRIEAGEATVQLTLSARASLLYQLEYSIDAEEWNIVFPDDGIADSRMEVYTLRLSDLQPGTRSIRVRAVDSVGNIATDSRRIEIP